MFETTKKLEKILDSKPIRDPQKLQRQQGYYSQLQKSGTAKKQTYNLKSVTEIGG